MQPSVVLTDSDDPQLIAAVEKLDGWRLERRPSAELPGAIGAVPGTRLLFLRTNDPTLMRAVIEKAHGTNLPVVVMCEDDAARRRAVEHRVEEWVPEGASAEE